MEKSYFSGIYFYGGTFENIGEGDVEVRFFYNIVGISDVVYGDRGTIRPEDIIFQYTLYTRKITEITIG